MKKITPIYIPALHRELAPAELPGAVLFLAPGLAPAGPGAQSFYQPLNLPFSGPAARSVLREMLELGSTLSQGGKDAPGQELRLIESGARAAAAPRQVLTGTGAMGAEEDRELENFSNSGELHPASAKGGAPSSAELPWKELVRAQKILLLAWELEENLLEIKKAETALAGQDRLLLSVLHGPEDESGNPAPESAEPVPVAWPVLLEAAAPFLPEDALLVTASQEIRAALAAISPLAELPPELVESLTAGLAPQQSTSAHKFEFAQVRLGDLVGGRNKTATRPWLDATFKFAVRTGN